MTNLILPKTITKNQINDFKKYYEITKLNDKKLSTFNPQSLLNTLATIFELNLSNNPIKKELALIPYGNDLHLVEEEGQDINDVDENGNTALMQAAEIDACEIFNYLIGKGANINIKNNNNENVWDVLSKNKSLGCIEHFAHEILKKNMNQDFDSLNLPNYFKYKKIKYKNLNDEEEKELPTLLELCSTEIQKKFNIVCFPHTELEKK